MSGSLSDHAPEGTFFFPSKSLTSFFLLRKLVWEIWGRWKTKLELPSSQRGPLPLPSTPSPPGGRQVMRWTTFISRDPRGRGLTLLFLTHVRGRLQRAWPPVRASQTPFWGRPPGWTVTEQRGRPCPLKEQQRLPGPHGGTGMAKGWTSTGRMHAPSPVAAGPPSRPHTRPRPGGAPPSCRGAGRAPPSCRGAGRTGGPKRSGHSALAHAASQI